MTVTLVYLGYIWICFIHSIFAGATLYCFFGKQIIHKTRFLPLVILTGFLIFLEIYWIPVIEKMNVVINVNDPKILGHFNIDKNTNIATLLRPGKTSIIIWLIQGVFADYIGRKAYFKIINSLQKKQ